MADINQLKREVNHYKGEFDTATRDLESKKREISSLEQKISSSKREMEHYTRELGSAESAKKEEEQRAKNSPVKRY